MAGPAKSEKTFTLVEGSKASKASFGDLIQEIAKARKMNQYQFAEKTGYSQSYISRVERGERPFSAKLCRTFADVLEVDADELDLFYNQIQQGADHGLNYYYEKLMKISSDEQSTGVLIRQLQREDLLKIFAPEANGEFTYRGKTEDCEIEHFNPASVKPTSYDTCVGAYIKYDTDGNEEAIKVPESVKIDPGQSMLVIVNEHITLPSWMEAEIHPASNIGQKHLIVSNGPVIDPGWSGYLKVSVFNPTNVVKEIRVDEPFLTLRFWMAQT